MQPIRHPFLEIAGDVYVMADWFELTEGRLSRDQIVLVRLTPKELRIYDNCRSTADSIGNLLPSLRRRLRGGRRR